MKNVLMVVALYFANSAFTQVRFFTRNSFDAVQGNDNNFIPIQNGDKYYVFGGNDFASLYRVFDIDGREVNKQLYDTLFNKSYVLVSYFGSIQTNFMDSKMYYATYKTYGTFDAYTPCLVKIDTNGNKKVWDYTFSNPTQFNFYDYSPDSYIYAQGETNRDTLNNQYRDSECAVMKIDTQGNEVWRYTINSSSYANRPGGIVATPDSGCLVVYYYGPWPAYSVARALKLDKSGGLQWVKNIPLNTNGLYSINLADYDAQQEILYLRYNPYSYLYQLPSMIAKLDKNMNKIWDIRMGIYDSVKIKDPLSANLTDSVYDYKVIDYLGYGRIKPNGFLGIGRKAMFPEINSDYLQMMNDSGRVLWEAHYDGMYQGTKRVWGGYHFSGYNTTSDGGYILTGSCRDTLGNQVGFLMKIDSLGCLTPDSCETRFISSIKYYNQPATSLSIYPNPASDRLQLNLQGFQNLEGLEISFYNLLGQKTHLQKITQAETSLEVKDWQRGIYLYRLEQEGRALKSGKVMID